MEGGAEDGEEEKRRGAEDGEEHCSGGDQPRAALSDGLFGGCRPLFFFLILTDGLVFPKLLFSKPCSQLTFILAGFWGPTPFAVLELETLVAYRRP